MPFPGLSAAAAIFRKDLQSELRTRYALNALLMFVLTTVSIILFAIGNETPSADILSGVFWVIVFFSAMSGLSRTFIAEEERGTVMTLQLVARPLSVYAGKLCFNLALLAALNVFTVLLYAAVITNFTIRSYAIIVPAMTLGTVGLASASTLIAAIISKANTKGTLYPVLSFPILLPLLLSVIDATRKAVEGAPFTEALGDLQVLISYTVVMITLAAILFEFVWRE